MFVDQSEAKRDACLCHCLLLAVGPNLVVCTHRPERGMVMNGLDRRPQPHRQIQTSFGKPWRYEPHQQALCPASGRPNHGRCADCALSDAGEQAQATSCNWRMLGPGSKHVMSGGISSSKLAGRILCLPWKAPRRGRISRC
jgi:hypothetical protein